MHYLIKIKQCRNCKKDYVVPGVRPGVCSVLCYNKRLKKLRKSRSIKRSYVPKDFYVSDEWYRLRYKAIANNGRNCQACGGAGEIHVDHIKPISKYPHLAYDINNLQVLCRLCNKGKSNVDETDWRSKKWLIIVKESMLELS